jgi:hypothetical protein
VLTVTWQWAVVTGEALLFLGWPGREFHREDQ